jgi:hypothetical protein
VTLFTRRDAILAGAVAAIHLAASISLLVFVFGSGMARFDSGDPIAPTERIARWLLNVLAFPVVLALDWLPGLRFGGLWGYIPFVLNASIWGLGAVVARRRFRPVEQQ